MSERLPAVRPGDLLRALERAGWVVRRQRGSHVVLHKVGSIHLVTVPMHGRDLPRGTLNGILEDAGLTSEEFRVLLRG